MKHDEQGLFGLEERRLGDRKLSPTHEGKKDQSCSVAPRAEGQPTEVIRRQIWAQMEQVDETGRPLP